MSTAACLSQFRVRALAPGRSRSHPDADTASSEPAGTDYPVGPAIIGVAVAWLTFFAIAIEQSLATICSDVLQLALTHLP
jgi:hypothetical protein